MKASDSTTNRIHKQQATTRTIYHVNRSANESDYEEREVGDDDHSDNKNDDESSSKDELESVERQRKSDFSSLRSEEDEESRDSFEPSSTSSSPLRLSSTAGRGGWSDTSPSRDSRSATNSVSSPSSLNSIPFVLESSKGSHSRSYQLRVAQHPVTGAACGSLSRLPLAPPLFVQLIVKDGSDNIIPAEDDLPFLVAIISLHKADSRDPQDLVFNSQLNGTTVACPTDLRDLHGSRGIYFIFPDVGVRCCGQWRLHVSLMRIALIGAQSILVNGDVGQHIAGVWTDPLEIGPQQMYVAPKITPLTKHFIRQGVQMFISSSVIPG